MKVSKEEFDAALRRIDELTRSIEELRRELVLARTVMPSRTIEYVPVYPSPQPTWIQPWPSPWTSPWCSGATGALQVTS